MRPSIRQVAEHARVSPMTVSRVLRGRKTQVAEGTFERVMASVRLLDYVPVTSVLQNRHVETCSIGIVPFYRNVSSNPIDSQTFAGLCNQAGTHCYDLLVMLRDEEEEHVTARFLDRRNDGFIFISPDVQEWRSILGELQSHNIPVVICYRRDVPAGVAWVDPDNAEIMRLAVAHLHQHGHRRLAYVSGPATHMSFDDRARQEAFQREIAALGLPEAPIIEGATETKTWKFEPRVLLSLKQAGITGVVCVNDFLALQLWNAAEEAGLRVPRDLSLVGVDDQDVQGRGLTSVGFSYTQVGEMAVESWVALQGGQDASKCCHVVPVHLVKRASVGPLRPD